MKIPVAASLGLLGVVVAAHAQDTPTFATEVELVQIEVRATGKDDAPVTDLRREDFVIEEDGERQEVELFEYVAGSGRGGGAGGGRGARRCPGRGPRPLAVHLALHRARGPQSHRVRAGGGPLRSFLEDLPDRFFVSLAGLPFTDNRDLLLATLDRMVATRSATRRPSSIPSWTITTT